MTGDQISNTDQWLIIPIEVQVRELLGRLLVGAIAAERGFKVLIGHDRTIRRLARFLPKGILFDKSLGMEGDKKVRNYHRFGYTICALDEESTGFLSNPELYLSLRLSDDTLTKSHRWFCHSDRLRNQVEQFYPDHVEKFVTTGLPRTDVWRSNNLVMFNPEVERLKAEHGNYILFCSNFGTIIHARKGAFLDRQYNRMGKVKPEMLNYRERIEHEGAQNLAAFIEMFPKLNEWYPDHKLIIRPHPSEDRQFWIDVAQGLENAEIHDSGIATPWILASQMLVHHGCTTGIEAELMGKPHVMYAPIPDVHHDTPIMESFAPIAKDIDTFENVLGDILQRGVSYAKDRTSLEQHFASLEGRQVSRKIVDEFEKLNSSGGSLPSWLGLMRFSPRQLAADYGPRSRAASAYSKQKWQGTSVEELNRMLAIMRKQNNLNSNLQVTEIFPQLYMINATGTVGSKVEPVSESIKKSGNLSPTSQV